MSESLLLSITYDDRPEFDQLTVEGLAELLRREQYGADFVLHGVYAMGPDNAPVPVEYTVTGARDFDADSWAYATVTVTMPDGTKRVAGYTIDGRA